MEGAEENQGALGSAQGIDVEPLLKVRREALKIGFSLMAGDGDGTGNGS